LRLEEAKLLREKIETRLKSDPRANIIVAGDLNDNKNSPAIRELIGKRGPHKLMDTRPSERNGQSLTVCPTSDSRSETWTYFYAAEDLYCRFDYLLLSPGMAREWVQEQSFVLSLPEWGEASDHRPVAATFKAADK
jgi:endonuclease/exonuclease/phosphatase family metal-dependent hydrolase